MPAYFSDFPDLRMEEPSPGVVHVILDAPGLNAVSPAVHRQLADVWVAIDRDPNTRVALISGEGKGFSAGGSFELLDEMINDYGARTRVMRARVDANRRSATSACTRPMPAQAPLIAATSGLRSPRA